MRYTVLGGRGFIGARLAAHLRDLGHEVRVPERDDPTVFSQDIGRVFYCIGLTADFRQRPLDTVDAHVCGLNRLLREGRFTSLVYLSSTRVYAGAASTDEGARLVVSPLVSGDLYNLSKLMGESLCLNSGRPAKVVRLSNVYGAEAPSSTFLAEVLGAAVRGEVVFRSDPGSAKDYIALDDVVRLLALLEQAGHETVYNLASGQNVSHAEIAAVLGELGCRVRFEPDAPRLTFPPISIGRLRNEFGLPTKSVLEDLPDLFKAFRERCE